MRNFSARAKNVKGVNRSFFPQATSSRISYATLAMAMSRNFSQEGLGWNSTRPVHFCEGMMFVGFERVLTPILELTVWKLRAVQLQRNVRSQNFVHKLVTQEIRPPTLAAVSC